MQQHGTQTDPDGQQTALDFAPGLLRDAGLADAHPRPAVGRRYERRDGTRGFYTTRKPVAEAWAIWPHVQHDTGSNFVGIFADLDHAHARDMLEALTEDHALPAPNVLTIRRESGHGQAGWLLRTPVHRYPHARPEPLRMLSRASEYLSAMTQADRGYTGFLFRNAALASDDDRFDVLTPRRGGYPLAELLDYVPSRWRAPTVPDTGVGRNVSLFSDCMEWAGSRANDPAPVLTHAHAVNATFPTGLPRIEVVHVAKHVEAYRERWRAQGWHTPRWIARQADRGRRSGLARRRAALERDARIRALAARPGWSRQRIADEVGVHRNTVGNVLRRHPPDDPRTRRDKVILDLAGRGFAQGKIARMAGLTQARVSQIISNAQRTNTR